MKDEKLEAMLEDYNNIEIPKELKDIVEVSVRRAKRENYLEKKRARVNSYFLRKAGVGFVAAMLAFVFIVNIDKNVAYAMSDIPVIGTLVRVFTFSSFESKDRDMSARIKVPQVDTDSNKNSNLEETVQTLNKSVEDYTDQIIARYKADVKATNGEGYEEITCDYEVITDNEKMFSLRMDTVLSVNTTGVTIKIYHINKRTGKLIEMDDIFKAGIDYEQILLEEIQKQMKDEMRVDQNKYYFSKSDEIPDFDLGKAFEASSFYFNKNKELIIVFDKYEVAPGYMGVCEFEIPRKITNQILLKEYLD